MGPDADALRAEVEAQGRARIEAIRRETRERIEAMRAEREAAAAEGRAAALRKRENELRSAMKRELALARNDGKRRVLEDREALLETVFERARSRLREEIDTPAARALVLERARQALRFVPTGDVVITCSPGIASVLEAELEPRAALRIETQADLPPGFRVVGAGGALVVEATLASLLERERPALAVEVLRRLDAEATP